MIKVHLLGFSWPAMYVGTCIYLIVASNRLSKVKTILFGEIFPNFQGQRLNGFSSSGTHLSYQPLEWKSQKSSNILPFAGISESSQEANSIVGLFHVQHTLKILIFSPRKLVLKISAKETSEADLDTELGRSRRKLTLQARFFFCLDKNPNGPPNYPQSKLKEKTLRDKLVVKNPLKSPAISGGGSFDG